MKITLLARQDAPETQLYVKALKKPDAVQQRQTMLLIPGGPGGNHTVYEDIENELLEFADLFIVDLRGCGDSDQSDVKYCTLDHHIRDIEALRCVLEIEQPVIHGASYGAIVALGYAIAFRDKLTKLILTAGAVSGDFIQSAQENLNRLGTVEQIEMAENAWQGKFVSPDHFAEYYRIMSPLYFYHQVPPSALPAGKNAIPYNVELLNYAFQGFLRDFDYQDQLDNVQAKTLIFCGENDWITDVRQAKRLHEGIHHSQLVLFEHCGHIPWRDKKKQQFINHIKDFVNFANC